MITDEKIRMYHEALSNIDRMGREILILDLNPTEKDLMIANVGEISKMRIVLDNHILQKNARNEYCEPINKNNTNEHKDGIPWKKIRASGRKISNNNA